MTIAAGVVIGWVVVVALLRALARGASRPTVAPVIPIRKVKPDESEVRASSPLTDSVDGRPWDGRERRSVLSERRSIPYGRPMYCTACGAAVL